MTSNHARLIARVGGILYLAIITIGMLGEAVVRGRIVVPGNATATAANLRAMEGLWRLGVAGEVVLLTCTTALALILYLLLRPVSRSLALAAVFFNLVCVAIEAVAAISLAAALLPVSNAAYLTAFTPEQRAVMAMLSVRSHTIGFGIALAFFGVECLLLGHLIFRSRYMPRAIGVLMHAAGACYVLNTLALVLSPPLSSRLFPAILAPAFVAELSLALWLLVGGVRATAWDRYEVNP